MKVPRENKKKRERMILSYFSHVCTDFPGGKIMDSESPDFIVKYSPKRSLGIELTRLTAPVSRDNGNNHIQIDSHEKEICEIARKMFELRNNLPLYVDVFFKPGIHIIEENKIEIAEKIVWDIESDLSSFDRKSIFQTEIKNPGNKDIIDYNQATYFPEIKASIWDNAGEYFTPRLSKELLLQTIEALISGK